MAQEELFAGRYRLVAELGRGATSRVYRAVDETGGEGPGRDAGVARPGRERDTGEGPPLDDELRGGEGSSGRGETVALKVLVSEMMGPPVEGRVRFRREARALSGLNHPNVVRIVGLGEREGEPYLVMEHVARGSLERELRRRETSGEGQFAPHEVVALLTDVARGLAVAHARGIVHRDLKPANVLLGDEGPLGVPVAKLADFGVAVWREARADERAWVVGTLGYMAPEQCHVIEGEVDERSDLFTLGVLGYELATGRAPFGAKSLALYMRELASHDLEPAIRVRPGLDPMLDAILHRLLALAPRERYQTALGLVHDLERLARRERGVVFELGGRDVRATLGPRHALVAREEAADTLATAWRAAVAGQGSAIVVEAPSGMGKTRLVDDVLAPAVAAAQGLFLRGKNYEFESPTPFRTFIEAARDFLVRHETSLDDDRVEVERALRLALADLDDALVAAVPELVDLFGRRTERGVEARVPGHERARVREALVRFFVALAGAGRPLALFLDDLQWSDDDALEVTRALAAASEGVPLLVVLACRDGERGASAAHAGALGALLASLKGRASFVVLAPLRAGDLARLTQDMLPGTPSRVCDVVAGHVTLRSSGNPLFAEELVRGLVADGVLRFEPGRGWSLDEARLAENEAPATVTDAVLARARHLSAATKRVIEAAAVIGADVRFDLLRQVVDDVGDDALVEALDEAARAYLLGRGPMGDYGFTSDRARRAVYEGLAPERRVALHTRALAKLAEARAGGASVAATELLTHSQAVGDRRSAYRYAREAFAEASARHAHRGAAQYLDVALGLCEGDDRERRALLVDLSEALLSSGRYPEAVEAVGRARPHLAAPAQRVRLGRVVAAARFAQGRYAEATEALEGALTEAGVPVLRSVFEAATTLLSSAAALVVEDALGVVRPVKPSPGDALAVIETLTKFYFFTDTARFYAASTAAFRRLRHAPDPGARAWAHATYAVGLLTLAARSPARLRAAITARARRAFDDATALEPNGSLVARALVQPVVALYLQFRHEVDAGLVATRRAAETALRAGDMWSHAIALDMEASMLFARADLEGAARAADRLTNVVDDYGVRQRTARALLFAAYFAFVRGTAPSEACGEQLARAAGEASAMGDEMTAVAVAIARAELALAAGDADAAVAFGAEGYAMMKRCRTPHPDALFVVATYARALVRRAGGARLTGRAGPLASRLAHEAVDFGRGYPGLWPSGLAARALVRAARAGADPPRGWDVAFAAFEDCGDAVRHATWRAERAVLSRARGWSKGEADGATALALFEGAAAHGARAAYARLCGLTPSTRGPGREPLAPAASQRAAPTIAVVVEHVAQAPSPSTEELARLIEAQEGVTGATVRSPSPLYLSDVAAPSNGGRGVCDT